MKCGFAAAIWTGAGHTRGSTREAAVSGDVRAAGRSCRETAPHSRSAAFLEGFDTWPLSRKPKTVFASVRTIVGVPLHRPPAIVTGSMLRNGRAAAGGKSANPYRGLFPDILSSTTVETTRKYCNFCRFPPVLIISELTVGFIQATDCQIAIFLWHSQLHKKGMAVHEIDEDPDREGLSELRAQP